MDPVIIIGAGLAGYTVAREFRKLDRETPVMMLTADEGQFYSKPMLSNARASGKTPEKLVIQTLAQMQASLNLEILASTTARAIDPATRTVLIPGRSFSYSSLVLAHGADPIRLPIEGNAATEILAVNDLADYRRFHAALDGKSRIAILGAGLIGCEFANDLACAGYAVNVIDIAERPLGRLLPPECGHAMQESLASIGVHWRFGDSVKQVNRDGEQLRLQLASGADIEADLVLSAIGLAPRIALAREAGISVERGIVTNRHLETSANRVYALGDCAQIDGQVLPFVMPIMHAARAIAANLNGKKTAVDFPVMPVVIKTPSCPTVVAPPPSGIEGTWWVTGEHKNVSARFVDRFGAVRGFALCGEAVAGKNELIAEMSSSL